MTPAPFDYVRAQSLSHAIALKKEHGSDASILAGGQSLVPLLTMRLSRPAVVVDIGHLKGHDGLSTADGRSVIGPLTRHRTIERDAAIGAQAPLLAYAARHVAYPSVRNLGTLGGAVALGDPSAEYPAVLCALSAQVHLASHEDARTVGAEAFFIGALETAAHDEEVVTGVSLPPWGEGDHFGFYEIAERVGDYALAGAAIAVFEEGRRISVAVFGVADRPLVIAGAAEPLADTPPRDWQEGTVAAAGEAARAAVTAEGASAQRSHLAGVAVKRAAADLAARARRKDP